MLLQKVISFPRTQFSTRSRETFMFYVHWIVSPWKVGKDGRMQDGGQGKRKAKKHQHLKSWATLWLFNVRCDFVNHHKALQWGNRCLQIRDPQSRHPGPSYEHKHTLCSTWDNGSWGKVTEELQLLCNSAKMESCWAEAERKKAVLLSWERDFSDWTRVLHRMHSEKHLSLYYGAYVALLSCKPPRMLHSRRNWQQGKTVVLACKTE